ncbi:MAG: arylsulfatase [Draconibacterium sp.]|nr:arylsulfatase [Draconibacterium sp.]
MQKTALFVNMLTLCVLLFSVSACSIKKQETLQPNIIFIMADDLGYGHLGCYGQEIIQTPYIDKLAEEGMRFTQAYSGSSLCAPARSTLMTGTHAGHTPVRGNGGGVSLRDNDVTIAELLNKAGYATGLFGKWGLGEEGTEGIPNKQGFDEFFGYLHQLHAQFYYPEFLWENEKKFFIKENANDKCGIYSHDLIMERAKEFVEKNQNQPFFLYLPLAIPHHEFVAPDEAMKQYSGKFKERPIPFWRKGYALPDEPRATMAAMISHMDKGIGELMELLDSLNLDENTLVIFTSDNGAAHGPLPDPDFFNASGPLRGLKGSLYEGGIRVPMIARWKGKIEDGSESEFVNFFPDIFPTLAEIGMASEYVPDMLDGISFAPVFFGEENQNQHEFLYWENANYERIPPYGEVEGSLEQAILLDNWKAVKNNPDLPIELYNISQDISETTNLASEHPELIKKIETMMKKEHHQAPPQVDMTAKEAQELYVPEVFCREE